MKTYINWHDYDDYINQIVNWIEQQDLDIQAVYGIPRGGLPMAVSLSHILGVPMILDYKTEYPPTGDLLVVDDIADTGNTLKDFRKEERNVICTFHYHEQSTIEPDFFVDYKHDKWIVYPWETIDSKEIQDYLKEEKV